MSLTLFGSPVAFSGYDTNASTDANLSVLRVTGVKPGFVGLHSALVSVHPALMTPGTLPLGGALVPFVETSFIPSAQVIRLLVNGSITFTSAGTTPGAPVVGTFSGDVGQFVPLPP